MSHTHGREQVIALIISLLESGRYASADGPVHVGPEEEYPVLSRNGWHLWDGGAVRLMEAARSRFVNGDPAKGIAVMDGLRLDKVIGVQELWGANVHTDAGLNQGEIDGPALSSLHDLARYQRLVADTLAQLGMQTGDQVVDLGHHPLAAPLNRSGWVGRARYDEMIRVVAREMALARGVKSWRDEDNPIHGSPRTMSQQATVDVVGSAQSAVLQCRVFNELSGLIIAMTGNSPVVCGVANPAFKAQRRHVWMTFPDKRRVGVMPRVSTVREYAELLADMIYYLKPEGGDYVAVEPRQTFWQVSQDVVAQPEMFLTYLRAHIGCIWWEGRVRFTGTISVEGRTPCRQPRADGPVVAALYKGLALNLSEALKLCDRYSHQWWQRCLSLCERYGFDIPNQNFDAAEMCLELLGIARDGLAQDPSEKDYLQPLFERCHRRRNPADDVLELWADGNDGPQQREAAMHRLVDVRGLRIRHPIIQAGRSASA